MAQQPQPQPRADGAGLQVEGRKILTAFYGALRALKLYPVENAAVQQAIDELHGLMSSLAEREGGVELRVVGDFFFLNDTRLRLDVTNFSTFGSFAQALNQHGLGGLQIHPGVRREEWAPFLSLLQRNPPADNVFQTFLERLGGVPVLHIDVRPETEEEKEKETEEALQAAKRTYVQSVKVAKDVLQDVRLGRAVNVRQVKRAVQNIVDQVLDNEPSMVTLTTLRDFDEYTFTHSVNVCIFSVVIGQRLKLDRSQLYELGLGGLLHDIGKMRLSQEVINKADNLTEKDWNEIKKHPTEGLLALFHMVGFVDTPYRQMLMAYEHHMKVDVTGYPTNTRPRKPGLFSRIVAVADAFDAGTSVRSYQHRPWPPDAVLKEMRDNPRRGMDPLLVKALITATGVFPVGTLVFLDTMEMAVVSSANPDPDKVHLPRVKVISNSMGVPLAQPVQVDLSEMDEETGKPTRQILKTADPQKYGIRVSDYLT
jgi:HD-GYP domain-containing protein (c-di-GMP phosphodiesterase class II)